MFDDPIVREVREARRAHAEEHGFDLHRIFESLRRRENEPNRTYYAAPCEAAKTVAPMASTKSLE